MYMYILCHQCTEPAPTVYHVSATFPLPRRVHMDERKEMCRVCTVLVQ